jgi:Methyltransferase domain
MCKICDLPSSHFDTAMVLGKYQVNYFLCPECGLVETEPAYWLAEAYADAIVLSDIGLLGRNLKLATTARIVIRAFFRGDRKFIDYGGGYGMFVRLMRDAGLDFYRYDKYCQNLFAAGFDADENRTESYELLTAFEVFEHLVDPLTEIRMMLSMSPSILFTTELLPSKNPPRPHEWWYYGLGGGQHLTLYTRESLELLAKKLGLRFYTSNGLHLLTTKNVSNLAFRVLSSSPVRRLAKSFWPARRSLQDSDYLLLTGVRK